MNNFKPGDIVCLKDRFSPEMMVIGETGGTGTVIWQNAVGQAMTEDYPATSLKAVSLDARQGSASVLRFADLLSRL